MAFDGWENNIPPQSWDRMLAMDTGGSSPNALIWTALDPDSGSLVAYDEVYEVTTDMRSLADKALPKMTTLSQGSYHFRFKVIDYENKIAAEDMRRYGIEFDNAVKHNKMLSVHRFSGYLHPNPRRPFPQWHPLAGQPGAPLFFITANCSNLIREIPQQRWKEGRGDTMKDEADRNVPNHAVDCCLYTVRLLPPAADVKIVAPVLNTGPRINTISALYWEDVRKKREAKEPEQRQKYRSDHSHSIRKVIGLC